MVRYLRVAGVGLRRTWSGQTDPTAKRESPAAPRHAAHAPAGLAEDRLFMPDGTSSTKRMHVTLRVLDQAVTVNGPQAETDPHGRGAAVLPRRRRQSH